LTVDYKTIRHTPHYDDNNNTTDGRRPVGTPAAADERIREFHRIYHLYYNVYYSKTTKSYDAAAAVSYWNHWNNSLFAQTCQIGSSPRHLTPQTINFIILVVILLIIPQPLYNARTISSFHGWISFFFF